MEKSRTPAVIVTILIFVMPLIYLGSYFALVLPRGRFPSGKANKVHYRYCPAQSEMAFWPLEQFHRSLKPASWDPRPQTVDEFLAQPSRSP